MKVVILCGGKGTRLREETEYKPKPMVEIGGRPILWHIMKLYRHYGLRNFILCMGYKHQVIRDYFINYCVMNSDVTIDLNAPDQRLYHSPCSEDWKVTLAYTGLETKKGDRLRLIRPYLDGERFLVTYGDGVANVAIDELLEFHQKSGKLATFTGVHPISRFATVENDEAGNIIDWNEKKPLEGYINAGFFIFENDFLEYIEPNVELEEQPLKRAAQDGQLAMYKHEGYWQCMDTYRDFLHLNELWDSRKAPWKVWI